VSRLLQSETAQQSTPRNAGRRLAEDSARDGRSRSPAGPAKSDLRSIPPPCPSRRPAELLNAGLTLADRVWVCQCGATHDRDRNAARNLQAAMHAAA
jgi:hypothetical protein